MPVSGIDSSEDVALLLEAASEAARIAMGYFGRNGEVWTKDGNSPVSEADIAVDRFLRDTLMDSRPGYGWLSEETEDDRDRLNCDTVFIVDPIDGTRGFISGAAQWCISMAVVHQGRPVAGVLACPAMERMFHASAGGGSYLDGEEMPQLTGSALHTVSASRKLSALIAEKYSDTFEVTPFIPSLAYRLAMVANGEIDAAFTRPGAHEWDTAAAEILLEGVGGVLTGLDGRPRAYNSENPSSGPLLATAAGRHEELLRLAKSARILH